MAAFATSNDEQVLRDIERRMAKKMVRISKQKQATDSQQEREAINDLLNDMRLGSGLISDYMDLKWPLIKEELPQKWQEYLDGDDNDRGQDNSQLDR